MTLAALTRGYTILSILFYCIHSAEEATVVETDQETSVLEFEPQSPVRLFEGDVLSINVEYNATDHEVASIFLVAEIIEDELLVRARMLSNRTFEFKYEDGGWICVDNCSVEVEGVFLGEAGMRFRVCQGTEEKCNSQVAYRLLPDVCHVYVSRHGRTLDIVFTVLLVIFGCIVNLGMGCKLDLQVVIATLKKPVAPAVGFCCQFLLMPPLAFAFTKLLSLSTSESIGLFSNGCSPGGGASNMWTLLFNADITLSITMTTISTFASLGMFPLWMFTLGRYIIGSNLRIAYENIIISLIAVVIPSIFGILIQRFRPNVAKIITKALKPLMFVLLIFIFTVGIYINLFMFKLFSIKLILASSFLPWSGFILGFLVSWITRRNKAQIIAIGLETGIQNAGVAVMTLRLSLPQPQNDLSIVGAVCPSLFTGLPLLLAFLIYSVYGKCKKKDEIELKDVVPSPSLADECPGTPASMGSTVFLTQSVVKRRKSVSW